MHSPAFPDGEIRGQIALDEQFGYGGTATGAAGVDGIENLMESAGDTLNGTPGTNRIDGRGGGDTINAGPADDVILGGPAADQLSGRTATTRSTRPLRTAATPSTEAPASLTAYIMAPGRAPSPTTDLASNTAGEDGEAPEDDDVRSTIEVASGGSGADVLTGNGADNSFEGNGGDDMFTGMSPDAAR